jgi:hypothetical protein
MLLLMLTAAQAQARPAHRRALADYFGPLLPKKLNDCRTCHLPDPPGTAADQLATEKPHNAFGARLKAVKAELRKAGKKTDIASRLEAVFQEDSDGDGVSNLIELLTGHFPGDASDRPTAAELAEAPRLLAAFEQARKAYRWTPFETVTAPAVPAVRKAAWLRNPIDAFIAAEHEGHGLSPRPPASRSVLLRRVYLDLIGIPPTRAELHAFLTDASPSAYEKVVERLLASPQYGERWGRHWMDVWRYSDWAGFGEEVRESQKHIWHWRDWIIASLNQDRGYDRMIQEMLAGDELAPTDPDTLRATGFLVRNWFRFNRQVWLDHAVEHTGKAFLGITLNCARCHDHMYDPILQKEYYAFRAIFEPHQIRADRLPGQPDLNVDGIARVYDGPATTPTYLFIRGNDANPDKSKAIAPALPAMFASSDLDIGAIKLPREAFVPDTRPAIIEETIRTHAQQVVHLKDLVAKAKTELARHETALAAARDKDKQTWAKLQALRSRLDANPSVPAMLADWNAALAEAKASAEGLIQSQRAGKVFADDLRLAEMNQSVAEAAQAELLAEVRTEKLEDAEAQQKQPELWKKAALEAHAAQQRHGLLEAQRNHFAAQLALMRWQQSSPTVPGGKRTTTDQSKLKSQLTAAAEALAKAELEARRPPTPSYTRRNLPSYPATSSGRRLSLARWITDPHNPLAARVAMNHLWLRHFGQAIVPSVFDFGRNGRPASHPALLDWLAAEFMKNNWSMKSMHRLIVLSNTYRMDSTPDAACLAADPDNRYLWRVSPRRLEAESVRDSVLAVAGQLDTRMGGPDIDYRQGLTVPRRSVYFRHAAEKEMEFLELFDAANVTECYRRSESIVPQQALALFNSSLATVQARLLARRLCMDHNGAVEFVRSGFEQVLNRAPTADEEKACCQFLEQQTALLGQPKNLSHFTAASAAAAVAPSAAPGMRAREDLIQVLLNHHDFVTIR